MLEYAKQYLNLVQEPAEVIWWKLFNASCSSRWSNILCLVQLLFCIPMANGHVERTFSILKLIKTERRNCLSENHLDDLMRISVDGPPLSLWDATTSVHLWWKDKQRRVGENKSDSASTSASTSPSPMGNERAPTFIDFSDTDWTFFDYINSTFLYVYTSSL